MIQPQPLRSEKTYFVLCTKKLEFSGRGDPVDDVQYAAHHQEHRREHGATEALNLIHRQRLLAMMGFPARSSGTCQL